ncbi:MAG: inorganic diphosphatase [Gemmatimonadetes bacterium]|uniref:Inorganic pyrophosphatase n=1 Tax=Candidatus Kutchimonas denitrificans TaxID=3056748 RepID=A0AAE4Z991_9BACT|nr:inorganic diphosphatase [Gemmatimonadota bacterium]NIR75998.1 inorganic diphosphatase [Candidatus Kutchimonas denitrificans]NIS02190.1 inorganic diphosphatase [Gemmatimonadota bacterium]NIT68016.1 inorganic diphosphatase [Gemmatimonadota bacterium]NIU54042.1 inorganic pyrophosphatase [Gemmatimonadota bacterium]
MSIEALNAGDRAPEIVNVVVEIPKGTRNKIEFDHELEVFRLDRVLHSPVSYPGDYGFIPGTLSPDGDPLDALVLVTDPTFTACVLSARPIAILMMTDEKGQDEKVLAVPDEDPRFEEVTDIDDLPAHLLKEVQYFFDNYKALEGKESAVLGWEHVGRAREVIVDAMQAFEH